MSGTVSQRFWSKVTPAGVGECWEWTGARIQGYGFFTVKHGERSTRAHRFAYQSLIGEVPDGLVLDHLCRNPGCVNPWHLEPVTIAVNNQRGVIARLGPKATRPKAPQPERTLSDRCGFGHLWSDPGVLRIRPGRGHRYCGKCSHRTRGSRAKAA